MATGHSKSGISAVFSWKSQAVARLTKIGEFGWDIEKLDVTTLDSSSQFKEYVPGMVDPGDFTIEGFLATDDTNGQVVMFTDAKARTTGTALITLPTTLGTVTFTGTALITEIKIGDITKEGIPIKVKLSWMGATTLSIGA